jgi:DNA-binding Lrp family transcriptional regulator
MDVVLVMNPYKIGYNSFAIMGIRVEPEADPDEVVDRLLNIPGVSNLVMVTGRYDLFIHYVCQNMEEFRQFLEGELRQIPGIANVESFIGLDLYQRKFELGVIG